MFLSRVKPKSFHYTPFYYDESKEKAEDARERTIKFKRHFAGKSSSRMASLLKLLLLAAFLIYVMYKLHH